MTPTPAPDRFATPAPPENLLDGLDATIDRHDASRYFTVAPVTDPQPDADATIVLTRTDEEAGSAREATIAALRDDPAVAAVTRSGERLLVRFADERIAALGEDIEAGANALDSSDLLAGAPYIVNFCDPNATKAFHVGHLRNLATGNAIACCHRAAGGHVLRQSQIGDCGRTMGEALAGYVRFAGGATPESSGVKSDHFVGELYGRYVKEVPAAPEQVAEEDLATARDLNTYGDLADQLLARLAAGEEEIVKLWHTVRDWTIAGQRETMARLGITIERPLCESDFEPHAGEIVRRGLGAGIFTRADSGAVVYPTGRQEYPTFLITRSDGFPTQNLRTMAVWYALSDRPDVHSIHVSGHEWSWSSVYRGEILRALSPTGTAHPDVNVFYAMVDTGGVLVKSSLGNAILIDELLDQILASQELDRLLADGGGTRPAAELAALLALAFFLSRPLNKSLSMSLQKILDPRQNPGWTIARAWLRARGPAGEESHGPRPHDPSYRHLVVRSQVHRRLLAQAVARLDVQGLMRFHIHLSRWYLQSAEGAGLDRAMRAVLATSLPAVGLVAAGGGVAGNGATTTAGPRATPAQRLMTTPSPMSVAGR